MKIDKKDLEILQQLQENARANITNIAKKVGLSTNATRYRFEKIKKLGLIKKTFLPIFLPKYKSGKNVLFRMQMTLKTTNTEVDKIVDFVHNLDVEQSQIECWKTIGHFNILIWIVSENPINFHVIKGKIQNQPGIIEIKGGVISNMTSFYSKINLEHLQENEKDG